MDGISPEKVKVSFTPGVTLTDPIIGRKYTLGYSTITQEYSIRISLRYLYEKIREDEIEIFGGWGTYQGQYAFYMFTYLDDNRDPIAVARKNSQIRSILPGAIQAIAYADRTFFSTHIELNYVPIIVYFNSEIDQYNKVENWGTFSQYESPIGDNEE